MQNYLFIYFKTYIELQLFLPIFPYPRNGLNLKSLILPKVRGSVPTAVSKKIHNIFPSSVEFFFSDSLFFFSDLQPNITYICTAIETQNEMS